MQEIGKETTPETPQVVTPEANPLLEELRNVVVGLDKKIEELKNVTPTSHIPSYPAASAGQPPSGVAPSSPDMTQQEQAVYDELYRTQGDFAAARWMAQREAQKAIQQDMQVKTMAQQRVVSRWNQLKSQKPELSQVEAQFYDTVYRADPRLITEEYIDTAAKYALGQSLWDGKKEAPPTPKDLSAPSPAPPVAPAPTVSDDEWSMVQRYNFQYKTKEEYAEAKKNAAVAEAKQRAAKR